jgi:hypothetical protein
VQQQLNRALDGRNEVEQSEEMFSKKTMRLRAHCSVENLMISFVENYSRVETTKGRNACRPVEQLSETEKVGER